MLQQNPMSLAVTHSQSTRWNDIHARSWSCPLRSQLGKIGEGYGRVAFIQVTYVTCQIIRKRPWLYPRRCSGLPKIDRVEVSAAVVCLGRFGNSRQWQVFAKKATCNLPIPIKSKLALFHWRFIEDRENMWTYNILSTWKPFNLYWLAWILGNVQRP